MPTTAAQHYLQSQGVGFPVGAGANLIGIKLVIRNTKANILNSERLIDTINKAHGVHPGINKHFSDFHPAQTGVSPQNASTNNFKAILSKVEGVGVGMNIDLIEINDQTFQDVVITEVYPDRIRFKHTTGVASLPMTQLSESLQKQLNYDPTKVEAFQAEQQTKLDAAKQRAKTNEEQKKALYKETVEPAPIAQAPTEPKAISNQDINPEFNGVPLSEIIDDAIIATSRSPIYDISGGDSAFCEAADRINSRHTGAKTNSSSEAYQERRDALQRLAKDAHPAKILGYVRPGFLLKTLNWKSTDSASVFFPKSIGGARFGAVRWSDFSMLGANSSRNWWNQTSRDPLSAIPTSDTFRYSKFKPYPLTAKTLLFDPFEASDPILSNADNTMTAAWIVQSFDPSVNSKLIRNGGVLGVVETRDGLFLGYLSEKGESGLSQITWEQATTATNTPFALKAEPAKDLKTGSAVFTLFDADTRTQKRIPSNNPHEFILFPETYSEVLQKGAWALKTSLAVPIDSGFEPLRELETQSTFQFEIQKKLDRIQIQFDGLDSDKLRLLVVSEYNIREVERTTNANGGETISAKPWRKKKEQLTSDIALSGDGSALFTDGERIFQIAAGRMEKPELTIYKVEANRLSR